MSNHIIDDQPLSSDEEDSGIVDGDTCSQFEIEQGFPVKYKIKRQSSVSFQKVFIISLCADQSFDVIAAGLSNNSVNLFDISTGLSKISHSCLSLGSDGSICGVRFMDKTQNSLLIGSTNGNVSLYDLRTSKIVSTYEDKLGGSKKPINCFDLNANGRILCMGTPEIKKQVYLLFFDIRQNKAMGGYWESHQDDVTDVKFHPVNPDLLCTGSTDGLINLFDISASLEDDALTSTINTVSSVQKINWHKNVYEKDYISCITHTNDFKLYGREEGDLVEEFDRSEVTAAIKRKSVADCSLVSCHNMPDGSVFLLAASDYKNGEALRSLLIDNKNLRPHAYFENNNQIIRESIYDEKSDLLVTGGERGLITLWSPSIADQQSNEIGRNKLKVKTIRTHGKNPY